ncbi:MAG: comEC, partial [Actinomycetia bacterium]|nr:comEC [Actinomycetes bacterium]
MSDRTVLVLAASVWLGASLAWAVPVPVGAVVVVAALLLRRPLVLVVGATLLASGLASAAWSGLTPPPARSVDAVGVLVGDPSEQWGAVQVDARLGHRRVEAWARGAAADELRPRLAGELVRVRGRLRPPSPASRAWLAPRHIAARLDVDAVDGWRAGNLASRAANGVRRTLRRGARTLDGDERALLLGVVLGDDHDQSGELRDAFRASGLSHLLVVSGENVAFVLALAGPVLRRLGLRRRWCATLALLAF